MTEQEEFDRLMESIERYEQIDAEEIEPDEYEAVLLRYVELRRKGYGPQPPYRLGSEQPHA